MVPSDDDHAAGQVRAGEVRGERDPVISGTAGDLRDWMVGEEA
jgi:hypothetical protein